MTPEYDRGYKSAKEAIIKGNNALELLNQAKNSLTNDDWDKDWKKACEESLTGFDILEHQGIDPRDFESDLY